MTALALAATTLTGCGEGTGAEPDSIEAAVRVDSIWRLPAGAVGQYRFGVVLTNHGNQPGAFKIQVLLFTQAGAPPENMETDPVPVNRDYSEELELTVSDRARTLVILTRSENSAVYKETDRVRNVQDL